MNANTSLSCTHLPLRRFSAREFQLHQHGEPTRIGTTVGFASPASEIGGYLWQ